MSIDSYQERILILDFGSQYSELIARRVREIGVYCEIHPFDWPDSKIKEFAPKGIVLTGGHHSVTLFETPRASSLIFDLKIPILGICYGMQTMAEQLGGKVEAADMREFGYAKVILQNSSLLLNDIESMSQGFLNVWMSHGDQVTQLPPGFISIGSSENCPIAMMADDSRHYYGLQFHPEVTHTQYGLEIIKQFVNKICGCQSLWTMDNVSQQMIQRVRKQVGHDKVLLGLSGGVDSAVVAALLHKAIKDQLICVFVDNGLLRHGEATQVVQTFRQHFGINLIHVDAADQFYKALRGVTDPEQKRKIIGTVFIEVFDEQAKQLSNVKWLAQGTIYPDVIESAATRSGKSQVIKTHHNVGGLPEKMNLKLLEPIRDLFKDEVRKLGRELGLAEAIISRHPFPGPGLGVRILGEVTQEYVNILQLADAIYIDELRKHGLYDKVSQAFCVFLPIKSVAVMGDARVYEYVISLRAVETVDFMTAHWAQLPYEFLALVSNRIINEVRNISRVVYDISSKPPATIEWE